jgi:two-component system LytT family sensor kinase
VIFGLKSTQNLKVMRKSVEIFLNIVFLVILLFLFIYIQFGSYIIANSLDSLSGKSASLSDFIGLLRHKIPFMLLSFTGPILCFYLSYFILVPKYLYNKQYVKFSTFSLLVIFISAIIISPFVKYYSGEAHIGLPETLFVSIIFASICWLFGTLIKGFLLWIKSITEKKALQKKHLESKTALLMLKAQINPHFLFNSLNNIDILINENPIIASEYLKKLSDILRYVLYETKEAEIELAKEIEQINSYIELQKIRTANPRYINFKVTGELKDQKIAPMIFLPFIENAFKHSKNKTIDNAIDVEFVINKDKIKMVCRNYYEAGQLEVLTNEGLGIETIKQRLNLLYPETHELIINKIEPWFTVTLCIKL